MIPVIPHLKLVRARSLAAPAAPVWRWVGRVHKSLLALAAILPYLEKQTGRLWKHMNDSFTKENGWEGRDFLVIIQLYFWLCPYG